MAPVGEPFWGADRARTGLPEGIHVYLYEMVPMGAILALTGSHIILLHIGDRGSQARYGSPYHTSLQCSNVHLYICEIYQDRIF